jgi:hypothetical protein
MPIDLTKCPNHLMMIKQEEKRLVAFKQYIQEE